MFEYFYHEILRRTIIGFGTLFNGITIKHSQDDGGESVVQVPLAYSPTQKFLARLEQQADLNKPVQITLPRMSFEFVGLTYDPTRKVTTTQTFLSALDSDKKQIRKTYMPVPYNMQFELSIYTKLNDDMLQIIEQIIPYFQPAYNITVDLVDAIGEKRDIPIVLEGISMDDNYEGNFDTRRALIYTLRFTAKTYLFGPVADVSKDIVKKVTIGYVAGSVTSAPVRDFTYSVEARATKNYDGDSATTLAENLTISDTQVTVADASSISTQTYIVIDNENMYVKSKSGNTLTVDRSVDGTSPATHVLGASVGLITAADNALIEMGDDFGFSATFS